MHMEGLEPTCVSYYDCDIALCPNRTYEMVGDRDAFLTFNHRGRALYPVLR